ncbi:hypothetical protein AB1Y20_023208 [Prymnesium parvum]|uniref:Exostosin GT47 domain-containing protein n=1 Tax=Prymnesium parvum TaxID=97485 RepID=A0AB34JFI8_PRYPA
MPPRDIYPSAANLSTCRSRCTACGPDIDTPPARSRRFDPPLFYLEASGALDHRPLLSAVLSTLASRPPDVVWPVGEGQYLIEPPILRALATHPRRTLDAERARIHVLCVAPWASLLLARRRGEPEAHAERMAAAARELAGLRRFTHSRRAGRLYVQLLGGESLATLGKEYQRELASGNVVLGCTDPTNAYIGPNNREPAHRLMATAITLPYLSHAFAAMPFAGHGPRSGLMFHGGLGRFDFGNRDRMRKILLRVPSVAAHTKVPTDVRIAEFTRGNNTALRRAFNVSEYESSGMAYKKASICMVPAGDVLSSRRLFDALSAGCVPLLLRSWYLLNKNGQTFYSALPFPNSVKWEDITLRLVPSYSSLACIDGDARWLVGWHNSSLERMRRKGHSAFLRYMDYSNPEGVASALLDEAAIRQQARHL